MTASMTETTALQPFLAQHEALQADAQAAGWFGGLRDRGMRELAEAGLPTPRLEAWKYTNLRPLEKHDFVPAPVESDGPRIDRIPSLQPAAETTHRLVFVNGRFRDELSHLGSLPAGVTVGSLAGLLREQPQRLEPHLGQLGSLEQQPMMALNTALMEDGFVLLLDDGVVLAEPIDVVFIAAADSRALAFHPRNLMVLGRNSEATVLEHHAGQGRQATLSNLATEVWIGPGGRLRHYRKQEETRSAFHLSSAQLRLARDASYDSFVLSTGARLSRNEVKVELAGEGAECHLNGAYLMRGEQHCDTTTLVEHKVPHTTCREMFRGVLDDSARAVLQGRIVVAPGAPKSDGHQLCQTLILSDLAEIDAKPELEIFAEDVKSSHGATAGELDDDALFYLRSRGIPEARARHILIESFLGEAVQRIAAEGLCPALLSSVANWLAQTHDETHGEAA